MDLGIKDRVVLVTGGSRGLGRQAALALAREGAKVAICARSEEPIKKAVEELKALGSTAMGVAVDITEGEGARRLFDRVVSQLGPVEILVNNVGGGGGGDISEVTEDQMKEAFELNLFGAMRIMKLAIPDMKVKGWGRIINISSIFGREYGGRLAYMTAKAALIALTKHMALTLAKEGILVNSVAPGSIAFPGGSWERFQREQSPQVVKEFIDRNLPMGRFGWPEPVGDLVAFLASERASLITGACINIDGGQSRSLI
ncbi:MAG: SDR family oxidoreductase [Chloroflexi bacterium]|nr:SDR family oxidoreductase [Chloroflexota bacterium]